jgi:hypothetical protein
MCQLGVLGVYRKQVELLIRILPFIAKDKSLEAWGAGHENEAVGDGYSNMKEEAAFLLGQAETVGLNVESRNNGRGERI